MFLCFSSAAGLVSGKENVPVLFVCSSICVFASLFPPFSLSPVTICHFFLSPSSGYNSERSQGDKEIHWVQFVHVLMLILLSLLRDSSDVVFELWGLE